MYIFLIKDEECFDKYNEIRKKLAILSQKKRINGELTCNKRYLKTEKNQRKRKLTIFLCTNNIAWFCL